MTETPPPVPAFSLCSSIMIRNQQNYNTMTSSTSPHSAQPRTIMSGRWCQILSTIAVGVACAGVGSCLAWPSSVLERFAAPDGPWAFDGDKTSWIVSLLDLGVVFGSLPAGWLADRFGRQRVMLSATLPLTICWFMLLFSTEFWVLCFGRFIGGIGSSAILVASVMYISEISSDQLRGSLNTLASACLNGGLVYSYSIGPYVSYQALAGASLALIILSSLCLFWIPESPWYLVRQGRQVDATEVMSRLRSGGGPIDATTELRRLQASMSLGDEAPKQFLPGDRKALVIILSLVVMQSLSGAAAVQSYSSITLPESVGPYEMIILYGLLTLVASLAAAFAVDRVGRKPLLFWASLVQTIALAGSATYHTLQHVYHYTSTWMNAIPAAGLLVFGMAYPIGLGTVPNVLQSEMFSPRAKGVCLPIVLMTFNILTFLVSKMFEVVARNLGFDVAFWFFFVDAFCATVFAWIVLKETKGKSLDEIQDDLNPDRTRHNGRPVLESEPSRATLYEISIESSTGFFDK